MLQEELTADLRLLAAELDELGVSDMSQSSVATDARERVPPHSEPERKTP